MDWTYDLYFNDINKYDIDDNVNSNDNYNAYFVSYVKNAANKFLEQWKAEHDGRTLGIEGYVGDAFAEDLMDWFSDFYKDTYGQRPHLPVWFYVHPLGLPMRQDIARTFCATPIEDAIEQAKSMRESF